MSTATLTKEAEFGSPEAAVGPKRPHVLLVEGDGFTRLVLLLRLRLAGFQVDFTSNGILGLAKLRNCQPDVLLVELRLCGLSGLELIKEARVDRSFGDRPIYVYTHADRINRATRKQLQSLSLTLIDKNAVSREELVSRFVKAFLKDKMPTVPEDSAPAATPEPMSELTASAAIQEMIAEVAVQADLLVKSKEAAVRAENCAKLLGQVRSVACCAEAAKLANLARHARALENLLTHLGSHQRGDIQPALRAVMAAVEVMTRIAATTDKPEVTRFSVVVFDEHMPSNTALRQALNQAGFDPFCFTDATKVREYLGSHRTDLILINVLVPETHSLSTFDIKRLPMHVRTPLLFGREPGVRGSRDQELPTSAAQLNRDRLMLAELVLQALNEVQDSRVPALTHPLPTAASVPASPASVVRKAPASSAAAVEDGFMLFAASDHAPDSSAASMMGAEASAPPVDQPYAADASDADQLTENLAPTDPQAEPAGNGADHEVEFIAPLAVTPVDGYEANEQPVEAVPPSDFEVEAQQAPQPEATHNDLTAAALSAAVDSTPTEAVIQQESLEPQHQDPAEESTAVPVSQNDIMNDQLQAVPLQPLPYDANSYQGQMALQHAQAQIQKKDKVIEALRQELAKAAAVQARPSDQTSVLQVAQARCAELEQEVATLHQALESFNAAPPQESGPTAAETELQQQLEATHAANLEHAAAYQEMQLRYAELEQQLTALRDTRDELCNKLAEEQRNAAQAAARVKELESRPAPVVASGPGAPAGDLELQVRQGVAALARATAELAQERGQRQRSEQRAAELSTRLQALHQDLGRTLQAQHEDLARIGALEEKQRELTQAVEQSAADLEQQQAERRLVDEQLAKANEMNAQLHKDVAFLEEANKRIEGSRQELQNRLEGSLNAGRETEARLQQERAERQRLSEELDSLTRKAGDRSERDLELSKLESALENEQAERKRKETQLAHVRHNAQDAAHVARALRANLRRQVREPVDDLVQSARSLLELELGDDQKKIAESVLENVLLVQTRLREPQVAKPADSESDPSSNGAE